MVGRKIRTLKYLDVPNPEWKIDKREARLCKKLGHYPTEVRYYDSSGHKWCARCGKHLEEV